MQYDLRIVLAQDGPEQKLLPSAEGVPVQSGVVHARYPEIVEVL
jgi:hypothetical protein